MFKSPEPEQLQGRRQGQPRGAVAQEPPEERRQDQGPGEHPLHRALALDLGQRRHPRHPEESREKGHRLTRP